MVTLVNVWLFWNWLEIVLSQFPIFSKSFTFLGGGSYRCPITCLSSQFRLSPFPLPPQSLFLPFPLPLPPQSLFLPFPVSPIFLLVLSSPPFSPRFIFLFLLSPFYCLSPILFFIRHVQFCHHCAMLVLFWCIPSLCLWYAVCAGLKCHTLLVTVFYYTSVFLRGSLALPCSVPGFHVIFVMHSTLIYLEHFQQFKSFQSKSPNNIFQSKSAKYIPLVNVSRKCSEYLW